MLVGISTMLAMRMDAPEFAVPQDEMAYFLKTAQNVARHYNVETTQKTLDWIAMIGVGGQVFGTRAVAFAVRTRNERAQPGQATPAAPGRTNIHPLRPDFFDGASITLGDGT